MKALSVCQPWAGLIAQGRKTVELRTWKVHYRGPLVICASSRVKKQWLERYPISTPTGCAVCLVDLIDVRLWCDEDEPLALSSGAGGFSWVLANVRPVNRVPVRGSLGLFTLPDEIVAQ